MPALAILALAGGESLYFDVYRFFTTAALVTFGGAYAVLAWVNQQVVEVYGWLTQADTVAGLALAETTPGPLIIVLQFIGFMAGWNHAGAAGPAFTATVTALLTSWAMFLPAVVLMLVGAPYVEKVTANRAPRRGARGPHGRGRRRDREPRHRLRPQRAVSRRASASRTCRAMVIAALAFAVLSGRALDVLWVIAGGVVAGPRARLRLIPPPC